MLLGLGSSYRGHDERLDRSVFSVVLALIGAGMAFLLAMTLLSIPEWITPRRFATWLLASARSDAAAIRARQTAGTPRLLPAPGNARFVLSSSSSLIPGARGVRVLRVAIADEFADGSVAEDASAGLSGEDHGALEASRVGWVPTASPAPIGGGPPPAASFRDPIGHVPLAVISPGPSAPAGSDAPPATAVSGCDASCAPPAQSPPAPPAEEVSPPPGQGTAEPPSSPPGQPKDGPSEKPSNPGPGQGKGNAPPGHGGNRPGRIDR